MSYRTHGDVWRKRNRLEEYDYAANAAYFITFCTDGAACVLREKGTFALTAEGEAVDAAIRQIDANHVHLLLVMEDGSQITVSRVIRHLKTIATRAIGRGIWQRSFYDHIIRDDNDYIKVWQYIDNNPVKWKNDRYHVE